MELGGEYTIKSAGEFWRESQRIVWDATRLTKVLRRGRHGANLLANPTYLHTYLLKVRRLNDSVRTMRFSQEECGVYTPPTTRCGSVRRNVVFKV